MKSISKAALICGTILGATSAAAQVGVPPSLSPFREVQERHEVTPFFGILNAKRDPAGVAPQGGPFTGLQYEWRATGPLHIGANFMVVNSERTRIDPSEPAATRSLGTVSQPLYAGSGFISLSLTGDRSWHHLMPMVGGGLGLISDAKPADVGGFKFGTRFALPWSAGIRWVPGGRLQLRADVKDWMYTINYPQSYYTAATSDGPVLASDVRTSRWTNNFAMSVGVSYSFFR